VGAAGDSFADKVNGCGAVVADEEVNPGKGLADVFGAKGEGNGAALTGGYWAGAGVGVDVKDSPVAVIGCNEGEGFGVVVGEDNLLYGGACVDDGAVEGEDLGTDG